MRNNYNIFDYYLIDSSVHKLSVLSKIVSVLIIIFCVIVSDSFVDLIVINFFLLIMVLFSNISFRFCIKNLLFLKFIIFVIVLFFSFVYSNILIGVMWGIKFIDIVMYICVVTMTTSFLDLVCGIEKLCRPFSLFFDVKSFSLKIGMIIKFFSLLYNENDRIARSKLLRGVRYTDMDFADRVIYLIGNIGIVFRNCFYELDRFMNVFLIKNYNFDSVRYKYRLNKWGKTDTILLVISVVVMVVTFIY